MSPLFWRMLWWTSRTTEHHVFHHHHQLCRRRLLFTTTATTTSTASHSSPFSSSEKSCPFTFEQMVARHKQAAACSFVLEDRSMGAFVWHRPSAEIIDRLLGIRETELQQQQRPQIFRWRVGSRDGKQKRFLLLQFPSMSSLRLAVQALDQRHHLPLYDRIGFLKDHHISEDWRATVVSYSTPPDRVQVQNELQLSVETLYQIVFDNSHLAPITFEDYNPLVGTRSGGNGNRNSSPLRNSEKNAQKFSTSFLHKVLQGEELLSELQYKLRFFILHQMELVIRRSSQELASSLPSPPPPAPRKRKRFAQAIELERQLELNSLMTQFEIVPFGSEVSGFGTADSDVDLCLVPTRSESLEGDRAKSVPFHRGVRLLHTVSIMLEKSRKVRQDRPRNKKPSSPVILVHQHFTSVQRIFRAFIPIIKCRSYLLPELNIDVSVHTEKNSGVTMAAYLYHCCTADDNGNHLVRPFILLLKSWAKHHRIVQETPGDWFSSFQMTALGVAYLQHRRLVPTIEQWQKSRSRRRSLGKTTTKSPTNSMSETPNQRFISSFSIEVEIRRLLENFFHFMINFDFWRHAFDLTSGRCDLVKPTTSNSSSRTSSTASAICIVNPFLPQLNITKTVSEAELERFLSKCQQSLEILSKRRSGGGDRRGGSVLLEELFVELSDRLQSIGEYY